MAQRLVDRGDKEVDSKCLTTRICENIDRAKKLLEYEPPHTLEQGLKESISWYINNLELKMDN